MKADWDISRVPEWARWVAGNYHYRDLPRYADGSIGSFRITHHQFIRELEEAFERGRTGDKSCWQGKREEWRDHKDQVK